MNDLVHQLGICVSDTDSSILARCPSIETAHRFHCGILDLDIQLEKTLVIAVIEPARTFCTITPKRHRKDHPCD